MERTLATIDEDIKHAEELKERVWRSGQNEEVREYRTDMYARIDRINDLLVKLYRERNNHPEVKR